VLAAGIMEIGGRVRVLELDEPRALAGDEVLIEVEAAAVGNWDDVVRTGGWDVGTAVPMALGVEAAGVVLAVTITSDPPPTSATSRCRTSTCARMVGS
jgi:NADPH:quinone reductase-like Zn-dependent oxidoreductase